MTDHPLLTHARKVCTPNELQALDNLAPGDARTSADAAYPRRTEGEDTPKAGAKNILSMTVNPHTNTITKETIR